MSFTLYKTGQRSTSRLDVTDIGRSTFMALVLVFIATLIIPAFGVFATLLSLEVIALLVGVFYRPRCDIKGTLPQRLTVGQTTYFAFTLRNISHWPAYQLTLNLDCDEDIIEQLEPIPYIDRLGAGQEVRVRIKAVPRKRGSLSLNKPLCSSIFPFNLFRFNTPRGPFFDTLILPAHHPLKLDLGQANRFSRSGDIQPSSILGVSPEYVGSRPFVTGDSPRLIDARAWARLAQPAVKEFQEDIQSNVGLILDNALLPGKKATAKDLNTFEAAVSLGASVATSLDQNCLMDSLVIGQQQHDFSGRRHQERVERALQLLANAALEAPAAANPIIALEIAESFYRIASLVFVIRHWQPHHSEWLYCARQAGCHLTVLYVGETSAPLPEGASSWADRVHALHPKDILNQRIQLL